MEKANRITEEKQLKAVADSNRLAILRRLMARPATISQLGKEFDKHPAWMRHHFRQLEDVGLIELAEVRQTRNYTEKFYKATAPAYSVSLLLVPDHGGHRPLIAVASHDLALELLAAQTLGPDEMPEVLPLATGSLDGLIALRQGLADIAGCHLLDADTGDYNIPYLRHLFPDRAMVVVTLAEREQGLMVSPSNPLRVRGIEDLARADVRFINRNLGSGTRLWLDRRLRELALPADSVRGYDQVVTTHTDAAETVATGNADVGLGIYAAAKQAGLDFVPLFSERYDLVVPAEHFEDPSSRAMLDKLEMRSFRSAMRALGGYDTAHTGHEERVAV